MKTITKKELSKILRLHKLWLYNDPAGIRANLSYANLSDANLCFANLSDANLYYANLSYANLGKANLSEANLSKANLSEVNLRSAILCDANLSYADLSSAILCDANLRLANLNKADLSYANLSNATTDDRYIQVACIGSEKRMTTVNLTKDIVWCGCFEGTLDEFETQIRATHADNPIYFAEYIGFINYIKSLFPSERTEE